MALELLNTLASVGTLIVIGATAIAAVVQLRHMRNSNKLTGLLEVLGRVEDPIFNEWLDRSKRVITQDLQNAELRRALAEGRTERENNPWINMINSYEWVGSMIKHRLIPEGPFMDVYSGRILGAWEVVEPVFAIVRRRGDPSIWENFEYLVVRARHWEEKNPNGTWPKGLPRLKYTDKWLAEDSKQT